MTVVYSKSEKKGGSGQPVQREIAIGNAVGDSTGWLPLGADAVTLEIRSVTISGTRTEADTAQNTTIVVPNYIKDQSAVAWTATAVIETKQEYEDDAQAGQIATVTGGDYVQKMEISEVADYIRVRITANAGGESIFMSCGKRSVTA